MCNLKNKRHFFIILVSIFMVLLLTTSVLAENGIWSALGSGMNGWVTSLAVDASDNLYAGGFFTAAGGVPAKRIAKWDGSSWSALGSGISGILDDHVGALAVDADHNLYAGGKFQYIDGTVVNNIAKWDGASWSALVNGLNAGVDNNVNDLVVDASGNLYAGGLFLHAGGVPAIRIAKWDGTSWSALGSGIDNEINALAVDSVGTLYAGCLLYTSPSPRDRS